MEALPNTDELLVVARNVIWFEPPEKALADTVRFLAYLMTYGTAEEIAVVKRHVGDAGFKEALEHAPSGIMDPRSWAYWNIMADRYPVPPMSQRSFDDDDLVKVARARANEKGVLVDIDDLRSEPHCLGRSDRLKLTAARRNRPRTP